MAILRTVSKSAPPMKPVKFLKKSRFVVAGDNVPKEVANFVRSCTFTKDSLSITISEVIDEKNGDTYLRRWLNNLPNSLKITMYNEFGDPLVTEELNGLKLEDYEYNLDYSSAGELSPTVYFSYTGRKVIKFKHTGNKIKTRMLKK